MGTRGQAPGGTTTSVPERPVNDQGPMPWGMGPRISGASHRDAGADQPRVTLPALRQEVHTLTRLGVPPTSVRTRWMLGFQRRLVRTWECEIECPKPGPLPQTSQVAATVASP
jgi:hypothetical protein